MAFRRIGSGIWTDEEGSTEPQYANHELLTNLVTVNHSADLLIFKTQADKKTWAKPEAFEAWVMRAILSFCVFRSCFRWEKGDATGDENLASENIRRFFEQHFHDNNDS